MHLDVIALIVGIVGVAGSLVGKILREYAIAPARFATRDRLRVHIEDEVIEIDLSKPMGGKDAIESALRALERTKHADHSA